MTVIPAVQTHALGKRYGSRWALRDCSLAIASGSVTALVGPNGAGKTTLLHLLIGLSEPSAGEVRVLGWSPREQPQVVLPRVGFVAQEHPLYRGFSLAEMLNVGRKLNAHWDEGLARERLARLDIPLGQKVHRLSSGQQAQVALTLALAKRPELLVLDEPVAALDPLARREFLQSLMEAVAEGGLTVLLSSHIVSELERVCDHLVILAAGGVRLAGSIEQILASHRLLVGPRVDPDGVAREHQKHAVIQESHTERQTTLLVRLNGAGVDVRWRSDDVGLEEVVLAYLGQQSMRRTEPERDLTEVAS
ncbi:MAG: ABC transporter ATP-binding protein [Actinobacteria bacterium]|nr:MAG: ABC transporter ATP-binding protein [Actinomycetota bacterium]